MASLVIPGLDLAPSVPSRVITVDVVDMTEGRPAAGAHVDFILPQDLHARADGKVLKAGSTRLTLDSAGHGEIRVPAYSSATRPEDWALLVKKSWAPHPYPIRVAPGTTKISLATLEPPMEVTDAMARFVITDATLNVKEGAAWQGTVQTSGGIAAIELTVPPGGVAFDIPTALTPSGTIDDLMPGFYRLPTDASAALGLPEPIPGTLLVGRVGTSISQLFHTTPISGTSRAYLRHRRGGNWAPWTRLLTEDDAAFKGVVAAGTDLRDVRDYGTYAVSSYTPVTQGPPDLDGLSYTLEVLPLGGTQRIQRVTRPGGEVWYRAGVGATGETWQAWIRDAPSSGGGSGDGSLVGAMARTAMETTGRWTTYAEEDSYLTDLAEHRSITRFTVGKSLQDRDINGLRIGDPSKPALLIVATQHGNEPGPREGAFQFARDIADATTLALLDMCVIIVPTANPDSLHIRRGNYAGVNLNTDWDDQTQPETRAVAALFSQYDVVACVDAHGGGYARQVSLRESEGAVLATAVKSRSLDLFNATKGKLEGAGFAARRYSDDPVSDNPWILRNWAARVHKTPSLLVEVPTHWAYEPPAHYNPPPYWQALAARTAFNAALAEVHENLDAFIAAKN